MTGETRRPAAKIGIDQTTEALEDQAAEEAEEMAMEAALDQAAPGEAVLQKEAEKGNFDEERARKILLQLKPLSASTRRLEGEDFAEWKIRREGLHRNFNAQARSLLTEFSIICRPLIDAAACNVFRFNADLLKTHGRDRRSALADFKQAARLGLLDPNTYHHIDLTDIRKLGNLIYVILYRKICAAEINVLKRSSHHLASPLVSLSRLQRTHRAWRQRSFAGQGDPADPEAIERVKNPPEERQLKKHSETAFLQVAGKKPRASLCYILYHELAADWLELWEQALAARSIPVSDYGEVLGKIREEGGFARTMTLAEIGKYFGLSRERTRNIIGGFKHDLRKLLQNKKVI